MERVALNGLIAAILALAACAPHGPTTPDNDTHAGADSPRSSPAAQARTLDRDPDGCTWVESIAAVSFGDQDTKHQALAQAVAEARIKAMHHLLGVRLEHRFIDFQQEASLAGEVQLTEHLLHMTQLGRILKEEIVESGLADAPHCTACRFRAKLRTCIVPEQDDRDRNFAVRVSLNRTSYVDGDEAEITVSTTRDAYLYVFDVDVHSNATLIFPNDHARDAGVRAGQVWAYPSDQLKARGVHAVARVVPGESVSAGMIRVIAARAPLPTAVTSRQDARYSVNNVRGTGESAGNKSLIQLMRKLLETKIEWVEDAQAFTVHRK